MRDIIIKCGIMDGEKVEGEIEEGGCEETFLCLSLTCEKHVGSQCHLQILC